MDSMMSNTSGEKIKEEPSEFMEYELENSPEPLSNKNFGVSKIKGRKQKNPILVYDSKKHPGRVYRFQKCNKKEIGGKKTYSCIDCALVKKEAFRKKRILCTIPEPFILEVKNKVVTDPDKLEALHMCEGQTKEPSPFKTSKRGRPQKTTKKVISINNTDSNKIDKEWEKTFKQILANIDRKNRLRETLANTIKEEPMDSNSKVADPLNLPSSNSITTEAEENPRCLNAETLNLPVCNFRSPFEEELEKELNIRDAKENPQYLNAETLSFPVSNFSTPHEEKELIIPEEENAQNSITPEAEENHHKTKQQSKTIPTRSSIADKNFGVAKTIAGRHGGLILIVDSKKEQGKVYRYRAFKGYKKKKANGAKKYLCIDCILVNKEARKNGTQCTKTVPFIYGYGNMIATDPENTTSCHFCEGWKNS